MNYFGLPLLMWVVYKNSFKKNLVTTLSFTEVEAKKITKLSKKKYKEIIKKLPKFDKKDSFITNIVNCALYSSFLLSINKKISVEEATSYYENSSINWVFKLVCSYTGKIKFNRKGIKQIQKSASLKAGNANKYSWNFDYIPFENNKGYEARFYTCGICVLMNELGLKEYIPSMCHLDYVMAKYGKTINFVRKYILANNGPYCDCGYYKKNIDIDTEVK